MSYIKLKAVQKPLLTNQTKPTYSFFNIKIQILFSTDRILDIK